MQASKVEMDNALVDAVRSEAYQTTKKLERTEREGTLRHSEEDDADENYPDKSRRTLPKPKIVKAEAGCS